MKVKAVLTLTVWYDDAENEQECVDMLDALVDRAANDGLLSGESPMTVDTFVHHIDTTTVYESFDPDAKDEWTDRR